MLNGHKKKRCVRLGYLSAVEVRGRGVERALAAVVVGGKLSNVSNGSPNCSSTWNLR